MLSYIRYGMTRNPIYFTNDADGSRDSVSK